MIGILASLPSLAARRCRAAVAPKPPVRVQNVAKPAPIFDQSSALEFQIEGPFAAALREGIAGRRAGGSNYKKSFPGFTLTIGTKKIPVKIQVRGRLGLDADLPNLKIDAATEDGELKNTPLAGANHLKLVTHNYETHDENRPVPENGLASPLVVNRQGLAYKLMELCGQTAAACSLAKITYSDPQSAEAFATRTQPALILEDVDKTAERWGGKEVDLVNGEFDQDLESIGIINLLRAITGRIMLGDWDWSFPLGPKDSRTVENWAVIQISSDAEAAGKNKTKYKLIFEDASLASMVTGRTRNEPMIRDEFFKGRSVIFRWMAWLLQQHRLQFKAKDFFEVIEEMKAHRAEAEEAVRTATVDEEGRRLALEHIVEFFEAAKPENYLIPYIKSKNFEPVYDTATGTTSIAQIGPDSRVRVLETQGERSRVELWLGRFNDVKTPITEGWVDSKIVNTSKLR